MQLNLDENFLDMTKHEFEAIFEKLAKEEIKTKENYVDILESFVQLDSLIESYEDLAIKKMDLSLHELEEKLSRKYSEFDFSDWEQEKIKNYISIDSKDSLNSPERKKLFEKFKMKMNEYNVSFGKSLQRYFQTFDPECFSYLEDLYQDQEHKDNLLKILKGRQKDCFEPKIYELSKTKLEQLSDQDFLPFSSEALKVKYSYLLEKTLSLFEEEWSVKCKLIENRIYVGNFGFIYLDSYKREGKFDRPWTQIIQHGDGSKRKAICIVGFSFDDTISPDNLRSLFHELGHAFHHITKPHPQFLHSGMNSLSSQELEYPSILMENHLLKRNIFLSLWSDEAAYQYACAQYNVLLSKTTFLTYLDQMIHYKEYNSFEELVDEINLDFNSKRFTVPYLNAKTAAVFSHVFEDDMYAGNYYWYMAADIWIEKNKADSVKAFTIFS